MSSIKRAQSFLSFLLALTACVTAAAQDAGLITLPRLVDSNKSPIEILDPREAVVITTFTVKADGRTADVEVIGGFYDEALKNGVVRGIGDNRYEPARLNGQPIDYYGYQMVTMVTIGYGMTIVDPTFSRDRDKVAASVQAGDFAAAEARLQDMIRNKIRGLFEYAFLNETLVPIYIRLNRLPEALLASRQATLRQGAGEVNIPLGSRIRTNDPGWPYILPRETLLTALRERFALAGALGLTAEALQTFSELNDLEPVPDDDPVARKAQALVAQFQTSPTLVSRGRIMKGGWRHSLARRSFTVTNVKGGSLKNLDLVCGNQRRSIPYAADADWTLPPAWGRCAVTFRGEEGTEFSIVEMLPEGAP